MIFILSGPSGSGKTTLRDLLLKDKSVKNKFVKSVSLSTRPRRIGEKLGKDYFFINPKEFDKLKKTGKILEWTKYLGYYYGTKKDIIESALKNGKNVLLCLDLKGSIKVKKLYPQETITIFVIPPSIRELRKRIKRRSLGTKEAEILRRIRLAELELRNVSQYDYALRNISLTQAVKRLKGIVLKRTGNPT